MLKKLIAYQRVFLSTSPTDKSQSPVKTIVVAVAICFAGGIMLAHLLGGTVTSGAILPIILAFASVWMVNRFLRASQPLNEMVPVPRQYIVFNVYLGAVVMAVSTYAAIVLLGIAFFAVITGVIYITQPQNLGQTTLSAGQAVSQGDLLFILVSVIVLFVGTTIAFIRNPKYRNSAYAALFMLCYGLLTYLKGFMPVSPSTGEVDFLDSFPLMPEVNAILTGVALAVLVIIPVSIFAGSRLYLSPPRPKNLMQ